MKRRKLIYILLIIVTFSCGDSSKPEEVASANKALNILEKFGLIQSGYYLVIPDAGCPGCINQAEQFLLDNISYRQNIKYVLTNFRSKKNISLKLGIENIENPKIILDANNVIEAAGFSTFYPIIFYLENGEVEQVEFVTPDNPDVLMKLRKGMDLQ